MTRIIVILLYCVGLELNQYYLQGLPIGAEWLLKEDTYDGLCKTWRLTLDQWGRQTHTHLAKNVSQTVVSARIYS